MCLYSQGTAKYAEETEMCDSSTLNAHEQGHMADLWRCQHQKTHLMKRNSDLKLALNNCEDANADLEKKNSALKKQIKGMEPLVKDLGQLMAEIGQVRAALTENETANISLKAWICKLRKDNEALKDHVETSSIEKSDNLLAKDMDKRRIANMTLHAQALQKQLEVTRMKIKEEDEMMLQKDFVIDQKKASIDEMINVGQDLKRRSRDLKTQLDSSSQHGGLSGQEGSRTSGGHCTAVSRNYLSLAEEFSLLPGFQVVVDKEVKVLETSGLQIETTNLSETVNEELKQEGEVTNEKVTAVDLTEVSALGNSASHCNTHWLSKAWTSCKRGALVGVSFGLGIMLPFCMMGVAMTSSSFMSTDAHQAILQHSAFLPPF